MAGDVVIRFERFFLKKTKKSQTLRLTFSQLGNCVISFPEVYSQFLQIR